MRAPKAAMVSGVLSVVTVAALAYLIVQSGPSQPTSTQGTSSEVASTRGSVIGVYIITTLPNGSVRTISDSVTSTVTGPSPCPILGPPNGVYLRILSDASATPVKGASVSVVQNDGGPTCNGVLYFEKGSTQAFISDGGKWQSLEMGNYGELSVTVEYSGASYHLSAGTSPLSVTCATLYVPSGRSSVVSAGYGAFGCP